MQRTDSFEKTLMLGGIGDRRRRGQQRMRLLHGITDSLGMGLGGLQELVMDTRPGVHGVTKSRTWLSDWTELNWKNWCRSWSSNMLATWCEEPTRWKSPWYWESLRAGWDEGKWAWDSWMALPIQWTWSLTNSKRWLGTGRPGMLQSWGCKELDMTWWLNNSKRWL